MALSSTQARKNASHPAVDNIKAIGEIERLARRQETGSERLGRRISAFIGTLGFVWLQMVAMAAGRLERRRPAGAAFDPYPFGLLTFIVSLEGVLIATFVLIAQNQMSRQSDERDHLNLQVDLLAEQEMTMVLRMLRRISDRLGVAIDEEESDRTAQLTKETDVLTIAEQLREELPGGDEEVNASPER